MKTRKQLKDILSGSILLQVDNPNTPVSDSHKVIATCPCGISSTTSSRALVRKWKNKSQYLCKGCHVKTYASNPSRISKFKKSFSKTAKTEEHRIKCAQSGKMAWDDPDFKAKISKITTDDKDNPKRISARARALKSLKAKPWFKDHMQAIRAKGHQAIRDKLKISEELRQTYTNNFKVNTPEVRRKLSESQKKLWKDKAYRTHTSQAVKQAHSTDEYKAKMRLLYDSQEYKTKMEAIRNSPEYQEKMRAIYDSSEHKEKMAKIQNSQEYREKMREICNSEEYKAKWAIIYNSPEYKEKISKILNDPEFRERMRKIYDSPEYKAKMQAIYNSPEYKEKLAVARAAQSGRPSSIQLQLYKYLDDLQITYHKEGENTKIGYYVFDCLINHNGVKILVECQGDYWYSLPKAIRNDKSKFTYINRYFPEYQIMYIWEHEFSAKNRVLDRLKLKLGINIETKTFNFEDITIKEITAKEYKPFLDSYHYIGKGRGGKCFGAYLNSELIACIAYSPPIRQNIAEQFDSDHEISELSRMCIHPSYHKKNFASWLISHTIKLIKAKLIVAYADTTVGHTGAIYKAANFKQHHTVSPDYWYSDQDGYIMHKRTLYGKAQRLKLSESEFASKYEYTKKFGGEKICYIYQK